MKKRKVIKTGPLIKSDEDTYGPDEFQARIWYFFIIVQLCFVQSDFQPSQDQMCLSYLSVDVTVFKEWSHLSRHRDWKMIKTQRVKK